MGFSVTAAHAIFFFAALTAGSVAMDALWESADTGIEARSQWQARARSQLDTNLSLVVAQCNGNCRPATVPIVEIDVRNNGVTVVDSRDLTFIIDGRVHTIANFTDRKIVGSPSLSTDLILPGETMRIELRNVPVSLDYANNGSDLPVQVATREGVIGRR